MKGKLILAVVAVVMVLGLVLAGTALAQGPRGGTDREGIAAGSGYGYGFVDEDGDGVNDRCTDGTCDGTCDRSGVGLRAGGYGQAGQGSTRHSGIGTQTRSQLKECDGECDGTCDGADATKTQQRLGANGMRGTGRAQR